ncbi:MAG: hypothetical protein IAG10_22275 [Planctomycetaceae bacterium]|nr:hypothetical protein [Planctomycetaceae bacterium]
MSASQMETKNLKLVPHAPEHLRVLLQGPDFYAQSFGSPPAKGLRDFFASDDVSPDWVAQLEAATAAAPWTHGFGLVHVGSGLVIGMASFKGPPVRRAWSRLATEWCPMIRARDTRPKRPSAGRFCRGGLREKSRWNESMRSTPAPQPIQPLPSWQTGLRTTATQASR